MGKIIRIGKPQTLKKYEKDIRRLAPYHIRKSKTTDKVDNIIESFKEGLNNPTKLNGIVEDDNGKVVGFFTSRLDTDFFANMRFTDDNKLVIFIEHLYAPEGPNFSIINDLYKGIRNKLREETGAGDLFIFTHRDPKAWIRFSEGYNVQFELFGYVLVDKVRED
jgi:hypothetical protein